MSNIYELQDVVKDFIQKAFNNFYDLDYWKLAVACEAGSQQEPDLLTLFDKLGGKVKPIHVTTEIRASNDEWDACCSVFYEWKHKAGTIRFDVTLVKDEVRFVRVLDLLGVSQTFKQDYDFAREFEKEVVIPAVLARK